MSFLYEVLVVFFYLLEDTQGKQNYRHYLQSTKRANLNSVDSILPEDSTRTNQPSKSEETKTRKQKMCTLCGKRFARLFSLRRHAFVHTSSKNYHCEFCNKLFKLHGSLKRHRCEFPANAESKSGERKHTCDVCGKTEVCQKNLEVHMRVHSKERPFLCELCGWSFGTSSNLYRHRRAKHLGMATYQ
ncbi:hypothetical protein CSKR_107852 [Clonorchis sinensis]|uniref:Uncharacterized protein n=2 Tax=Clonorchis sinensis TaxID=79923 RepID=A0A8T1MFI6_CLOSI|nr:hypothetical protein CSKR_107852 [Clonorchis sinensis]GAA51131.1 myoneurin [Clonorchis sinensis]